jgi:demethylmenaquinone methyltransferase/2-methoxy-6-polyprenyl-1,4-benzoquinol methylase
MNQKGNNTEPAPVKSIQEQAETKKEARRQHLNQVSFGSRRVSPQEKKSLVQDHFDTVAARYDLTNTLLSFGLQHVWKRKAVAGLGLKAGERVLDACGGTADLGLLAAGPVGPHGRVILYDFNRAMLAVGQIKIDRAGLEETMSLIQGDAEQIALQDHTFDAAMVGFGIRNLASMEAGLQELHRVLKPGGRLLILEFSQPTNPWFRTLYDLYSFTVMPLMGKIMMGSWEAYTYLPESIRLFASPAELSEILRNVGFSRVTYQILSNGIAIVYLARKS